MTSSRLSGTGHQLHGVTVWHHHNHLLGLTSSQQVIHDIVHTTDFVVHLFGIGGTADEVKHRVAFLVVTHIGRWQINHGMVGGTNGLRIVVDILHPAMCHISNIVRQGSILVSRRYLQQTVLETFVGEVLRILRVHHTDTVDNEAVGIHVGRSRSEGHRPQTVSATGHVLTSSKLHVDHHVLGGLVFVLESDSTVSITAGLCHHGHRQQGQQG